VIAVTKLSFRLTIWVEQAIIWKSQNKNEFASRCEALRDVHPNSSLATHLTLFANLSAFTCAVQRHRMAQSSQTEDFTRYFVVAGKIGGVG
jgi:hypothetical protein